MSRSLERALQRFRSRPADGVRAAMQERLRNLERDVGDLKNRVNGLLFLVAGTVITQLLARVLA